MSNPLTDLPGAPPAGDPGWQQAQSSGGTIPGRDPIHAPTFVDVDSLTPAQRHAYREVIRTGDRGAFETFVKHLRDANSQAVAANIELPALEPPVEESAPGAHRPGRAVRGTWQSHRRAACA